MVFTKIAFIDICLGFHACQPHLRAHWCPGWPAPVLLCLQAAGALPSSNVRSKPPSGSSRSRPVQPAQARPPAKATAVPGPGAQRNKGSHSPCAGPPAGAEGITVAAGPGGSPGHTERRTCRPVAPQAESRQRVTGRKRSRSQSAIDSEARAESARMAADVAAAAAALQNGSLQQQQQQRPERVPASSPPAPAAVAEAGAALTEGQPARQGGRAAGAGKRRAADFSILGDSPEAAAAAKRQRVNGGLLVGVMYQCIRQVGASRQATPQPNAETATGLQQPAPSARVAGERPATRAQAAAAAAAACGQALGVEVGPLSDHSVAVRPASAQPQPAAARPAQLQPRPVTAEGTRRLTPITAARRPGTGSARATSHAEQGGGRQRASAAAPAQDLTPQQLLVLQRHSRQAAEAQLAAVTRSAEQDAAARASAAPNTARPAARTTVPPQALHARPPVQTGNRALPADIAASPPRARHEAAPAQHSRQAPRPAAAPAQPRQQAPRSKTAPAQPRQQPLQVTAPPAQPSSARRSTAAAGRGGAQSWQQYEPAAGQGRLPRRAAPARRGTSYEPPEGMKVHWDSLMHPERARQAR